VYLALLLVNNRQSGVQVIPVFEKPRVVII
jgi:hypothetical protein